MLHSWKRKGRSAIAGMLSAALLSGLLPQAGADVRAMGNGSQVVGSGGEPAVQQAVYGIGSPAAARLQGALSTAALSWGLLSKVNKGLATSGFASLDDPVTRMSADERYVALLQFQIGTETQPASRKIVTVYDRLTGSGAVVRTPDTQGSIVRYDMTPDARYVVYSYAESLASGKVKVYVYDRQDDVLEPINEKVSTSSYSLREGDYVSISADGRYVAFDTEAKGVTADDQNDSRDVFVYDRQAGNAGLRVERISVPISGSLGYSQSSWGPTISADGSKLAFVSDAQLLEEYDPSSIEHIYWYDRQVSAGAKLKVLAEGTHPAMDAAGQRVVFTTHVTELDPNTVDTNDSTDIYVYDAATKEYRRISMEPNGQEHQVDSRHASISPNGRYVAYETDEEQGELDLSEAFVADLLNGSVAKVHVPNASKPLLTPTLRPDIGDGGQSVSFFSKYRESFAGVEFDYYDYFVASAGTAPQWPGGASITATAAGAGSVTVSWPEASDTEGIAGYQLYRDGVYEAFVSAGAPRTYTYTGLEGKPGIDVVLAVDAVDHKYHVNDMGLTHTWKPQGGGGPVEPQLLVSWEAERRNAVILAGTDVVLQAVGASGRTAQAEVRTLGWENGQQTIKNDTVGMTEVAGTVGRYQGRYRLPDGTAQLTSIQVKLTDGSGSSQSAAALGLPVNVSGSLKLSFTGATGSELAGSMLTISHPSYGQETRALDHTGEVVLDGLRDGEGYTAVLRTSDYRFELGRLDQLRIHPGLTTDAVMPIVMTASLRVKLVDSMGLPIKYVSVELWDGEQRYLTTVSTQEDGRTMLIDDLRMDQELTLKVNLEGLEYELVPPVKVRLGKGVNEHVITLVEPAKGDLVFKVVNPAGQPVFNAHVTAVQSFRGKQVVTKAKTSLDGTYRLTLFEGEVTLEAAEYSNHYSSVPVIAHVQQGKTTYLDIPVRQPETGIINLKVYEKALDTEWEGPVNLEQRNYLTTVHTRTGGWMRSYFSNAMAFHGLPGHPVEVCVTGFIYATYTVCQEATLDAQSNATAELRLEEKGARIQGQFDTSGPTRFAASIYEIKPNGAKTWVTNAWDDSFTGNAFNLNIPRAGTFRMEVTKTILDSRGNKYEYAAVEFSVADRELKQLGELTFSPSLYFTNRSGNYVTALPNEVVPGATVVFRVGYRNSHAATAQDTRLQLEVPEGMSLVTGMGGEAAVTGGSGPAVIEAGRVLVPLGDLKKDQSGVVTYKLQVSSTFQSSTLSAAARIQAKLDGVQIEETIGTVNLDVPGVTIQAPERLSAPSTVVSGFAPAGSKVMIHDSKVLVGSATAAANGYWQAVIELTELGSPSVHALSASTELGGIQLQSQTAYVEYDADGPQLLRMAMAQAPNGRWMTIEAGKTISRQPYTVVPGNPFQFDLEFTKPDDVKSVRVYVDGQLGEPVTAVREGALFRAILPTSHAALGGIYVDYDVKTKPYAYDGTMPSLDEVRQSLPLGMRDFVVEEVEPYALKDGVYTGRTVLAFPQQQARMTFTMTVKPQSSYVPTTDDVAAVEVSGLPVFGSSYTTEETEQSIASRITGYIPAKLLFGDNPSLAGLTEKSSSKVRALSWQSSEGWGAMSEFAMDVKVDVMEPHGKIKDIKGQYESYMGYSKKVNKLMYNVENGLDCLAEMPTTAREAGKALAALVLGEVAKTAIGAGTAAMSLAGPAGAAVGAAAGVVTGKIDKYVDEQIDKVGSGYNECNEEELEKKRKLRDKGRKVADPRWIYDPSGYVYEGVRSNRVEGVKAVVLFLNPQTNQWETWNAAEYDQVNPQATDEAGRYGWDVPPGRWKVQWSKEGYEPKESAELDVPPPHTEVDANLMRLSPPQLESVTGVTYAGGSYVDLKLSTYVQAGVMPEGAVKLRTLSGDGTTFVEGTASFLLPEPDPDHAGVMLTRVIRFTPVTPLAAGASYEMIVKPSFKSYANRTMTAEAKQSFTVTELDTAGPKPLKATVEGAGSLIRITFNEPVIGSGDTSHMLVNGEANAVASAVVLAQQGQTPAEASSIVLTLNETVPAGQTAAVKLLSGAVTDRLGNASVEAVLTASWPGQQEPKPVPQQPDDESSSGSGGGVPNAPVDPLDVGGGVKPEQRKTASGGTALVLTISAAAVEKALKTEGRTKPLYVQVTEQAEEVSVELPVQALRLLTEAKAELKLLTSELELLLPAGAVDLTTLTDKARVQLTVVKAAGEQEKAYVASLRKQTDALKLESSMLRIRLNGYAAETGAEAVPVKLASGKPLTAVFRKQQANAAPGTVKAASVAAHGTEWVASSHALYRYAEAADAWGYSEAPYASDNSGSFTVQLTELSPSSQLSGIAGAGRAQQLESAVYAVMSYTNRFADTLGHWGRADIEWMARRLLVKGAAPDAFKPDASVTRAEFTAMLVRALGSAAAAGVGSAARPESTFADVLPDAWYYSEVMSGVALGLVNGLEGGLFAPDATITREQMTVMIGRAYAYQQAKSGQTAPVVGKSDLSVLEVFADREHIDSWAAEHVALAVKLGLVQGKSAEAFVPDGSATRAESAAVLSRLLRRKS
ncbi:S-layer homology domain-containing protein [Paenibacillus sp. YYML68]|uniref:S-layer homology domain-containing protein n=1 Tax=Paenibacillus sp. YYML68 TaxID=2909250 RepID=UPI00248F7646|nr:S-layer homology domain-containing protein [Paenibacillus sp. YYML68]